MSLIKSIHDAATESESAWPRISAQLREIAGDDNRPLIKQVDIIDKLHELAEANGLPQVTMAELEAAMDEPP